MGGARLGGVRDGWSEAGRSEGWVERGWEERGMGMEINRSQQGTDEVVALKTTGFWHASNISL
jgi:hypothetical protein